MLPITIPMDRPCKQPDCDGRWVEVERLFKWRWACGCKDRRKTETANASGVRWKSIHTAPLDGTEILIFTTDHGITQARFAPGEWDENMPEGPREYRGAVWVCGDDAWQIEIEEISDDPANWHHGTATHWALLPAPPSL